MCSLFGTTVIMSLGSLAIGFAPTVLVLPPPPPPPPPRCHTRPSALTLRLSMTVAAAIPITRLEKEHLHPDRQRLEAHIARFLRPWSFICISAGLVVMVAGASEDTGLAKER